MLQLLNLETVGTNQWMGLQLEGSCVYMLLTFQYSGHLIMSSIDYSKSCRYLAFLYRFIDDGTGCWTGPAIEFFKWFCKIYKIF